MKLKFKIQPYQTAAVESVTDCFAGQINTSGLAYRIDPGSNMKLLARGPVLPGMESGPELTGFRNADIQLTEEQLLKNIRQVQIRQNIPLSEKLAHGAGCAVNLDVEMETGTGKTYCYIKTIFELNKLYGWSKYIVVVPSVAIREGVKKSFEVTAEHFIESYGRKARFFIYNSRDLSPLESFSSDAGINVMIINIQAFNATGKDNRRIYDELDDFQTRRPIDVIRSNHPILILDEPQKMEGKKTLEALAKFNPLMILRYSATHRVEHNKIHRLDALDAYNQKLVKKIAVRGIAVKGLAGTNAYLYLESIEISPKAPIARMELEIRQAGGSIKRVTRRLGKGDNLFVVSNELDQYRDYVISQIDARTDTVEFTNGLILAAGEAVGDVSEAALRRIQIREAVRAHLEKERRLYPQGIKVLTLFFIDEVAKYRDYGQQDDMGEYARWFEEEYRSQVDEFLRYELPVGNETYRKYLEAIPARGTHNGYFSIDKKKNRLVDPAVQKRGEDKGLSEDADAYDLILKDKERLLSLDEPVRFIFSHSALREGWDNPNVFVMCMLKHSDNTISRRQEVGRGLRLCVNQRGDRMDDPATVHTLNVLTVVASESYKDFVANLQREIGEGLSARPRKVDAACFTGQIISLPDGGTMELSPAMGNMIHAWLVMNEYVDAAANELTPVFHAAREENAFAPLPPKLEPYREGIFSLVGTLAKAVRRLEVDDDRTPKTNPLNENFWKKEFQALWRNINKKAVYQVDFDSGELIENCIRTLNAELRVTPLQYVIQSGGQQAQITAEQLKEGSSFVLTSTKTETHRASVYSGVHYDLLGKLSEHTRLTRHTLARILGGIHPSAFDLFRQNPEHFITEAGRLINEQKAACVVERLTYDCLTESYDTSIFTDAQNRQNFSKAGEKLRKHVYDYAITDSNTERAFVRDLDVEDNDVVVYAKLPGGFFIPTPVGEYHPDWAIAFREGSVKHIYFVAETKGSMSSLELRAIEQKKIDCARKFFEALNREIDPENVHYDMVNSYEKLMEIVGKESGAE